MEAEKEVCLAQLRCGEVVLVLSIKDCAADVRVVVKAVILSTCRCGWFLCCSCWSFCCCCCRLTPTDGLPCHDAHCGDGARYGGLERSRLKDL